MISPGRELDALVAQHVMGLEVVRSGKNNQILTIGKPDYYDDHGSLELFNEVPEYSTSIAAAWEVVEELAHLGCHLELHAYIDGYVIKIKKFHLEINTKEETAPHAICLAALKAVGVEIE